MTIIIVHTNRGNTQTAIDKMTVMLGEHHRDIDGLQLRGGIVRGHGRIIMTAADTVRRLGDGRFYMSDTDDYMPARLQEEARNQRGGTKEEV